MSSSMALLCGLVIWKAQSILLAVLCNVCFEYLGEEYSYKPVLTNVDLDYFNIRQWRELYSSLLSEIENTGKVVHLKIIPLYNDLL